MKTVLILFVSLLVISSCKKKKPTSSSGTAKTDSNYFIRPTLDGNYIAFEVSQNNVQMETWIDEISGTATNMVCNYAALIGQTQLDPLGASPSTVLPGSYFVGFGAIATSDSLPNSEFHTVFGGFDTSFNAFFDEIIENEGFYIVYSDGEFQQSTSFYGSQIGDQTGSSFSITSNSSLPDYNGIAQRKITGTVSCKLYNYDDETLVKTLTNTPFSIVIQNVK